MTLLQKTRSYVLLGSVNHCSVNRLLFSPPVDFQYSLLHRMGRSVGFPVMLHTGTHMEQTRQFAVVHPPDIFLFVDAEGNPAVQAFCKYSAGFLH